MKKFLEDFKAFALKGNVIDMAIGVIIAGAFSSIVTSFTENIINPIIACLGGTEIGLVTPLGSTGQYLNWGALLTAIVNFLIMALVLFFILKAFKKAEDLAKKPEEPAPEEPKGPTEMEQVIELLKEIKEK
ncbi:MAG: large conductance mechanosensitive channel protein MscL [Erysipelotrichaceae bacterium]|nr:large conductance mechanosensitive channel protein MscL [Erysipelotrichaceae bacterium]